MQALRTVIFAVKGMKSFLKEGLERHKKDWVAADLEADLTGQTAVVTGASVVCRPGRTAAF